MTSRTGVSTLPVGLIEALNVWQNRDECRHLLMVWLPRRSGVACSETSPRPNWDTSPLPDASVFEAIVVRDYGGRGGAAAKRR